jgi:hypothetical protein
MSPSRRTRSHQSEEEEEEEEGDGKGRRIEEPTTGAVELNTVEGETGNADGNGSLTAGDDGVDSVGKGIEEAGDSTSKG